MSATQTRSAPRGAGAPTEDRRRWAWLAARWLGAAALLAVGAVHLQQYFELYSSVPTIGMLFVLNFVGATALGAALLAPVERWGGRWGGALLALVAAGGVALAAGTFVMLAISESRPLFGYQEPGYDPVAIAASRVAEVATVVLLAGYLIARFVVRTPIRRW
jgi:energy-converting hydrogenase Eha subunit C